MNSVSAVLTGKKETGPSVKSFYFKPEEKLNYKPGQYGLFQVEHEGKTMTKPFSFSCSPKREHIEITTMMSGSEYKTSLDSLAEGSRIIIKGPAGSFTLDAAHGRSVCFLAGGIGITPVKSILEHGCEEGVLPDTVLFYANRNVERIVFRQELEDMSRKTGTLRLIHVISRIGEQEKNRLVCESGYIDADMIRRDLTDYAERQFFIVGPPPFNEAMIKALSDLEISSGHITTENFAGY